MATTQYKLRYLPLFLEDLYSSASYIRDTLLNPEAADRLVSDVEASILFHARSPESATLYPTTRERPHPYYWFSVGNYYVFYVVINDAMEVRRLLHKRQNIQGYL